MSVAWFVDGAYLFNIWRNLRRADSMDYTKLRSLLESRFCDAAAGETIDEAYYFNADPDPPTAKQNAFHGMLAQAPPRGPGLRVKMYWLQTKKQFWPERITGKPGERIPVVYPETGEQLELTQQKGVDVGLAFHLMRSHSKKHWKKLFLAAGDGDFHEVVQHLVENEGVSVILIGAQGTVSSELRPYASALVEIEKEVVHLSRPKATGTSAG
jgi:uncharacterized LabA/DUF88 family protein